MTDTLDRIFEGLATRSVGLIIHTLAYRPAAISQLAEEHKLSLPAIHKHIKILEGAQLIQRRKSGRTNFTAFNSKSMSFAQDWINQYHTARGSNQETAEY